MEGDGAKGVLTILQNLDNNEVVIALGNTQSDRVNRRYTKPRLAAVKPLYPQKSSVHTNTDAPRDTATSRHVQICDDRFTSCYQVAHCSVNPTSPPVPLSEFPPQRPNPIYNEGNFEIGGYGSRQSRGPCRANHFRGGLTWPDRGSVYCNNSSRDIDAFAHSLRKYPMDSPDRSVSSELVEKLLKYTQAKFSQKAARTKSLRSLPNDKSPDRRAVRQSSRHQTTSRAQEIVANRKPDSTSRREESPIVIKKDRSTNNEDMAKEQESSSRRLRNFRLRSPASERNVNRNESPISSKYDYLKAGQWPDAQGSEQLRLDEISRQMRNVIRQIYNPRPVVFQVCPKIQKRYIQHKKTCPVKNSATWMTEEDEEEASSSRLCRFLEAININCGTSSETDVEYIEHSEQESYCQCTQTSRCSCEPKAASLKSADKLSQADVASKLGADCDDPCECRVLTDEEYYRQKLDEQISQWFNTIPVRNNERSEDRKLREDLVKKLAETIKKLPDDEDFEENVRDAIEKCMDAMPMWYPGTAKDKERIRKQLEKNIFDRITRIPRKADKLKDAVKDFINSINFKEGVNKKEIVNDFVKNLRFFAINAPQDEDVFEELLIDEVNEMLNELPIQHRGDRNLILKRLARKFACDIKDLLRSTDIFTSEDNLKDTFKEIISNWFDEVGEINENLATAEEIKKYINDLASNLDTLQSQGIDEAAMNKMESEISRLLDHLDIPIEAVDEFTDNLMDKVTDVVYEKDKNKFDRLHKHETFKELNNWIKNLHGGDQLSPVEQYKLIKEIVEKVEDSKDKTIKDYQGDIFDSLAENNVKVDPAILNMQLNEIANKLNFLPEMFRKNDLIANMQKDMDGVIAKLNIPEIEKSNLKEKAANIISKNIAAGSLTTRSDIDDMKEILLEQLDDLIAHLPRNVQLALRTKFDDSLDNNIKKTRPAKDKDITKYKLLKDINYAVNKEPIPLEEKDNIKYNIKNVLNENFDQPYSYIVKENIKDNVGSIIHDAQIERDKKDNLRNKLKTILDYKLDELPPQSIKDHIKNKTLKDMNKVIDISQISEDAKNNIKQRLNRMLNTNFDQPYSTETKMAILKDIKDIISDSVIPRYFKTNLIHDLTNTVAENLDELPDQTAIDYTKESVVNDIDDFLDTIPLTKAQLNDLKNQLESTFAEFLDRPYTRDQKNKLIETLDNIINKLDMPSDDKEMIIDKLNSITAKKLDRLPYQTAEEYAKDTIVRDVMHMLNDLSLTAAEKDNLEKQLEHLIDDSLHQGYLGEGRDVIKDGIVNIIRETSASEPEQDDLIFKTLHAVSRILDESYYEDHERAELQEFYDMIDKAPIHTARKNILKPKTKRIVDDHTLDPEYSNVKGMIQDAIGMVQAPSQISLDIEGAKTAIDDDLIEDIINAIKTAPIPHAKKDFFENKVNTLLEKLTRPQDLEKTVMELENIVDEIPLPSHDKTVLKSKLAMIYKDPAEIDDELKNELIKDLESVIDYASLGKEKNIDLKSKIRKFITDFDEPISSDVKDKIKDSVLDVVDKSVHSKEKQNQLRERINSVIDKLPTQMLDQYILSARLLARIDAVIDETPIRQHIKKNMKSQIKEVVSQNSNHPFNAKTKQKMKSDIAYIITEAPITEYQKSALKYKLSKIIDQLPEATSHEKTMLENIYSIVDEEPLSKVKKSELKKKIQQHFRGFDEVAINDIKDEKIKDILKAVDDTVMPHDKKVNLKAKLQNVLTKAFETLPHTPKQDKNLLDTIDKAIVKVLDDALIPHSRKRYLKKRMKEALSKIPPTAQPSDLENIINTEFANILNEVALSAAENEILQHKLAHALSDIINGPQSITERSAIRVNLLHNIDNALNEVQMPKDRKKQLQFKFTDLLDEISKKPVTTDSLKGLGNDINNIIDETPLPKEKKAEIKNRLTNIVEDCIQTITMNGGRKEQQTKDAKTAVLEGIDSILNQLQVDVYHKDDLHNRLAKIVDKIFEKPVDGNTIDVMKDDIINTILEAPIPRAKKADVREKVSGMIDKKIDKKAIAESQRPSLKSKEAKLKNTMHEIDSVLGRLRIPNELKTVLKQKLKDKVDTSFKKTLPDIMEDSKQLSVTDMKKAVTSGIDSIVDQLQMTNYQKDDLKTQLKDMVHKNFEKPLSGDTILAIKHNIDEIVAKAPIPKEKKSDVSKKLTEMVKKKVEFSADIPPEKHTAKMRQIDSIIGRMQIPPDIKNILEQKVKAKHRPVLVKRESRDKRESVAKVKEAVTEGMESIIEEMHISKDEKSNLKQKLDSVVDKNLSKPINIDTMRNIQNQVDDIISKAPVSVDEKSKIKKQLKIMVEKEVEPALPEATDTKYPPVAEIKQAVAEGIQDLLDQMPINNTLKNNLQQQLNNMVTKQLEKPVNAGTIQELKNKINNIITEAPMPAEKKAEMRVKFDGILDKHVLAKAVVKKHQPVSEMKAAVTEEINTIVDQLQLDNTQTNNLKQQLNEMVAENLAMPVNSDTIRIMKNKINEIIVIAPIPKDKKAEMIIKLSDMVDNQVPAMIVSTKHPTVTETKTAVSKGIDSILDQVKINDNQKSKLKEQLNYLVGEHFKKPVTNDTIRDLKNKINDIIAPAPIPKEKKDEMTKKLGDMIDKQVPTKTSTYKHPPAADVKEAVTEDIDVILNHIDLNTTQKNNLKHQLNNMVADHLQKPITNTTMRELKIKINDIIAEAPIASDKKAEIKLKLSDMVDEKVSAKVISKKYPPVTDIKANVTAEIDTIIDDMQMNVTQKSDLKQQLNHMVNDQLKKPVTIDTIDELKNKINDIISGASIPRDIKTKMKLKLSNMVDQQVQPKTISRQFPAIPEIKANVTAEINTILDEIQMDDTQKSDLRQQLNNIVNEQLKKPVNKDTMQELKIKINDIIIEAPIPRDTKTNMRLKMSNMVDQQLLPKIISKQPPDNSDIKATVTEEINLILDPLKINDTQKRQLKHKLNDIVDEHLAKPIDSNTLLDIKDNINHIISEAPITIEQKIVAKRKLSDMVDHKVPTTSVRKKYPPVPKMKAAITKEIDSFLDQLQLNNTQKNNLKHQLHDIVDENLARPINSDTMQNIKRQINNIIAEAPISRDKKAEMKEKLSDVVDSQIVAKPASSRHPRIADIKETVSKGIHSILDQMQINDAQKSEIERQLNYIVDDNLAKPVDSDTMQNIKHQINDVIADSPIPRDKKAEIKIKFADMVDDKVSGKAISKKRPPVKEIKVAVTEDINAIVDQLQMNDTQKRNLKHQLNEIVDDNLAKPITGDTMRHMKNQINDIIAESPIPRDKKAEVKRKLSDMVDDDVSVKPITHKYPPVSDIKTTVTEEIDKILDQIQINDNQKGNLKHQLNKMVDEQLKKPINKDTMQELKHKMDDIIAEAPISRDKKAEMQSKLTDMVDTQMPAITVSKKHPSAPEIKAAVTEEINTILDQLQLTNTQKNNLKHQLQEILDENFEKPIDSSTIDSIKKEINHVIATAPISRDKKAEMKIKLADMVDDKVSGKAISKKRPPVKEIKVAVTEDINAIVDQLQMNDTQKRNLKHQLNEIVDDNLAKPITSDTMRHMKNQINDIIAESPIPRDKKTEVKRKLSDMVDDDLSIKPITHKYPPVSDIKTTVTEEIDTILDQIQINDTQKGNLKHQLNKMVDEQLKKPINKDTMQELKHKMDDIIAEAPISRDKKAEMQSKLTDMVNTQMPAITVSKKRPPPPEIKAAVTEEINTILDQLQLTNTQKNNLKHQLQEILDENFEKPIDSSTIDSIKKEINHVIATAPISRDKKAEMKIKLADMVDDQIPATAISKKHPQVPKIKAAVTKDINTLVDQLQMNDTQKSNLKQQFNEMVDKNLAKPITRHTMKEMKDQINDIIGETPVSKDAKAEMRQKLVDIVDKRVPSPVVSKSYPPVPKIKAAVSKDINSIVDQLQLNNTQKSDLKNQLQAVVDENLAGPIDSDIVHSLKDQINGVIAAAPIPSDIKDEMRKDLSDMVDIQVPSTTVSKAYPPAPEMKAAVTQDINAIVDHLQLSNAQKSNLKHQLQDVVDENLTGPVDSDIIQNLKDLINRVIASAPIPSDIKIEMRRDLSDMVDDQVPIITVSKKYPQAPVIKAAVIGEISSILETLKIDDTQKSHLKNQLNEMVNENLTKPINSHTMRNLKYQMNDIIAEASIPKDKKAEMKKKLFDMVDEQVPAKAFGKIHPRISDIKETVTKDINSILDEIQINDTDKKKLKQQLNLVVDKQLEKPVDRDTMRELKSKINDIIAETSIPRDKKAEMRMKFGDMVDQQVPKTIKYKHPPMDIIKEAVTEEVDVILDQMHLDDSQKRTLQQQLDNMMKEQLARPITTDTMRKIKNEIKVIVAEAPISKDKKDEMRSKLSDMVDKQVPSKSISSKYPTVEEIKETVAEGIDSILNQMDMNAIQKSKLKEQLNYMVDDHLDKPIDNDTLIELKNKINDIITEAPVSREEKTVMRRKLADKIDSSVPVETVIYEYPSPPELKAEVTEEIDLILDQLQLSNTQISDLKHHINEMVNKHLSKPIDSSTMQNIKKEINDIIAEAPISRDKQVEIKRQMSDMVDRKVDSFPVKKIEIRKPISKHKTRPKDYVHREPKVIIKDDAMRNIYGMLQKLPMRSDEKINVISKINDKMARYSEKPVPIDLLEIIKDDINDIIEETRMTKEKKKDFMNKIFTELNENIKPLSDEDYPSSSYRTTKVAAMSYEHSNNSKKRPLNSRSQQDSVGGIIYDADDEDTKDEVSVRIPARSGKKVDMDDAVLQDFLMAIDELEVSSAEKAELKRKLIEGSEEECVLSERDMHSKNKTTGHKDDSSSSKDDKDISQKRLSIAEGSSVAKDRNKMLKKTGSVIRKLPVADDVLDSFMGKLASMSLPEEEEESSEPASSPEESFVPPPVEKTLPVTSTPKKKRKGWNKSKSSLANDTTLNPAIRNYWQNVEEAVNNWLDGLPIDIDEETKEAIRRGIADDIRDRQKYLQLNPNAQKSILEELEGLQYQVFRRLSKVLDEDEMRLVMEAGGDMMKMMKNVEEPRILTALAADSDIIDWESPEKLQNIISHWIDQLPLDPSLKADSNFQLLKQDLVSNLLDKLDEMNRNPEIFKNDALYDQLLRDEVDKLIHELPIDPDEIVNEKEALIEQIKNSMRTARAGTVGMTYKQQLKDAISNTLPLEGDASADVLATLELMKGDVADAFISLHYSGDDEQQKKKMKKKIYNEITKFCDDYMKRHPSEALNRDQLAEDLYTALKNVPTPPDESMKLEEEHIRVKDVVEEWMKEIPLKELNPTERLQLTRKVAGLAKRLKDIERNDAQLTEEERDAEMRKQIKRFLNKIPLKPGQEKNIDNFTDRLISKLRGTEAARRVDDSTKYSIRKDDTLLEDTNGICPYYKALIEKQKQLEAKRRMRPPCSLSKEDKEHLERIRQRTCMTPDCLSSLLRGSKRSSYVSPMATDSGSQTEQNLEVIGQRISFQPCPSVDKNATKPCPGVPAGAKLPPLGRSRYVESGSQIDIQPQVIIKEYYWDTADTCDLPAPASRHSTDALRCKRYTVPCARAPPCPGPVTHSPSHFQNKSFQTCQDRRTGPSLPCSSSPHIPQSRVSRPSSPCPSTPCDPSPCPSRPCSPPPCSPRPYIPKPCPPNPCQSPMSESFIPHQRATPQNSYGPFIRDYDYKGPKRNGLQSEYPECSGSRYSRKERVIELGSLDDLRRPRQAKRADDYEWTSHFPEDDFWETSPSRYEIEDDSKIPCNVPYLREKKEERVRCKCKERLMVNANRRRPRQQCQKHSNIWSNCTDNSMRRCSRCFGSRCPYPSYMYFRD